MVVTVQLAPTAKLDPHVVVDLKSAALGPLIAISEKLNTAVPTFFKVTVSVDLVPTACAPK